MTGSKREAEMTGSTGADRNMRILRAACAGLVDNFQNWLYSASGICAVVWAAAQPGAIQKPQGCGHAAVGSSHAIRVSLRFDVCR